MKRRVLCMICAMLMLCSFAFAEGNWHNILLLGNDTRSYPKFERSDTMIIISINEERGKVKLTSILRDTDVSFASGGSGKINGAMAKGGPENAVATVNKNFNMDIEDYVVIDFKQMVEAIDLIGGVDIEVAEAEGNFINTFGDRYFVDPETPDITGSGMKKLEGWQAVTYARDRKSSAAGDYDRVIRQRKMLIALLNELQEKTIDEVMDLSDELMDLISTNMSDEQLMELGKFALALETDTIDEFRIPANGAFESGTFNGVWKIKPNIQKNTVMLHDFIYGTELKKGSSGESVRKLQQKLADMGLLNDKVDGVFGNNTENALKAAQQKMGVAVNGIADEEFLDILYAQ